MRDDRFARSFLAELEPSVLVSVLQGSQVHHCRSGDIVVSETDAHWTGVVLSGMARVFLRTPSGRQVTLRHAQPGSSIGIGALLGDGAVSAQAVTGCEILRLDRAQVLRSAESNASLALAIAKEASIRLVETYREIVIREQGSVRQRLARQLLNFAGELEHPDTLVLPLSHEDVADAVGSAREVVSRHLERFQTEQMLSLDRGQITLVDPIRLDLAAKQMD